MKRSGERGSWFDPTSSEAIASLSRKSGVRDSGSSIKKELQRDPNLLRQVAGIDSRAILGLQLGTAQDVLTSLSRQYGNIDLIPREILEPVQAAYQDLKTRFELIHGRQR